MATLKQRQKAELKALNLECEARLQGKKGLERTAELKAIEELKRSTQERHEKELEEEAEKAAAVTGEDGEPEKAEGQESEKDTTKEHKISRARQRALKKAEKEEEEKRKRKEDAAKRGPTKRDDEIMALTNALSRLGLRIKEINPDGNCMFSAVSHQMKVKEGATLDIQTLRKQAVEIMKSHPAMFAPFLPENENLDSYCSTMAKSGEWGGELELRALSLALKRQIWVHRMNSPVRKWGEDEGFDPASALHLTFHEYQFALGEHYNSAEPDTSREF